MNNYYIFNKAELNKRLTSFMEDYRVFYPCKVNSTSPVIEAVKSAGASFEVDSPDMIKHLIKKHKVAPDAILFNYLARSKQETISAIKMGVKLFSVDSMSAIKELNTLGDNLSILIRISIADLSHINNDGFLNKWGASIDEALKVADYVKSANGLNLLGFSFYFPQEYKTMNRLTKAIQKIREAFSEYGDFSIDIGGGLSNSEAKEIAEKFGDLKGRLIMEPGRYLVGDCFDMICKIEATRTVDDKNYVFLSSGIYSGFIDVMIKNHRFDIKSKKPLLSGANKSYLVCGCTADISDFFGEYIFNEECIAVGKQLIIKNCGAYCPQMHMIFSGHGFPKIKII